MEHSSCAARDRSLPRPHGGHRGRCPVRGIADPAISMGINIEGNTRPLIRREVATEKNEQIMTVCASVSANGPAGMKIRAGALQVRRGRKFIPGRAERLRSKGLLRQDTPR